MFTDIYQPNTIRNQVNGKIKLARKNYDFNHTLLCLLGREAVEEFYAKYEPIDEKVTLEEQRYPQQLKTCTML